MNNKVIGPLTLWQFLLLMGDSSVIYIAYKYLGYGLVFWVIFGVIIFSSLLFWLLMEQR